MRVSGRVSGVCKESRAAVALIQDYEPGNTEHVQSSAAVKWAIEQRAVDVSYPRLRGNSYWIRLEVTNRACEAVDFTPCWGPASSRAWTEPSLLLVMIRGTPGYAQRIPLRRHLEVR